ncbi:unnamed protein product [Paramecium sonneborni]|uniref:Uncharacterized protein n=1 Tax=Paramecium sonneborni TaxID=65129 RepID=A0A8S1RDT1_9CILI|nr:unnamed protein product [Paramecium sonneborni]
MDKLLLYIYQNFFKDKKSSPYTPGEPNNRTISYWVKIRREAMMQNFYHGQFKRANSIPVIEVTHKECWLLNYTNQ